MRQLQLSLREQINRPLTTVDVAAQFLRVTKDYVVDALIPSGQLLWVFNIASPGAERIERRILVDSIDDYLNERPAPINQVDEQAEWDRVIAKILPSRSELRSSELADWLCCDKYHITHLTRVGALVVLRPSNTSRSAIIDRASVAQFLKERRIV